MTAQSYLYLIVKRVLITGMSGTGKSTVIEQLSARGYKAIDLDNDEYSEWITVDISDTLTPEPGRDWVWRVDRVHELLSKEDADILFVSGCAENMGQFIPRFSHIILLTASADVLIKRLTARTNNSFGKESYQVEQVLALQKTVEPLLRKVATRVIDTCAGINEVVLKVLSVTLHQTNGDG
jgi:dephospho-CoA kinase